MLRFLLSFILAFSLTQCHAPSRPVTAQQAVMPAGFCYLDDVAPSIAVDLAYAGDYNFVGRPLAGYEGKRAILRCDVARAMAKAADILAQQSLGLIVFDAYRPRRAMEDITRWSKTDDARMQSQFYPRLTKKQIFEHKYLGEISEHSWGIAVDITLVDLKSGRLLDMGGHFDLLDPCSATHYEGLTAAQKKNRSTLCDAMAQAGFKNYSLEWWHFWLANAPHILSYDFVIRDDLKTR